MNELVTHLDKTLPAMVGVLLALVLLGGAFHTDKITARWARQATAVAAVFCLIFCSATLALIVLKPSLPRYRYDQLLYLKSAVAGIFVGMIITLFMSGTFIWGRSPKPTDH